VRSTVVRHAVVAVSLTLIAGACGGSGGSDNKEAAEESPDGSAQKTSARKQNIALSVAKPVALQPSGALNPTTAVDPDSGRVYAAWARELAPAAGEEDPMIEAVVATSEDGGKTFGDPVVVSPPGMKIVTYTVSPTQVAVGHGGEVYVLFLENSPQDLPGWTYGYSFMRVVRSDDGGRTWSAPVAVTTEATEAVTTSTEMATLFVAPDNDLFVAFLDMREEIAHLLDKQAGKVTEEEHSGHGEEKPAFATQLRLVRSGDGGRTWSPSVLVSKPTCACCGTQVAQASGDSPVLVTTRSDWKELKGSVDSVRDPFVSVSTDDGATFGKPVKIHDDQFKISGCPDVNAGLRADGDGVVHAAWYTGTETGPGVYYATSGDDGKTWSKPVALLTDEWIPYGDVKMVLDDEDRAWVVYEDRRDEKEDRIQVVRINDDGSLDYSKAWAGKSPDLAADGDGVVVTWGTTGTEEKSGSVSVTRVSFSGDADESAAR
jgi:hypothetical protein